MSIKEDSMDLSGRTVAVIVLGYVGLPLAVVKSVLPPGYTDGRPRAFVMTAYEQLQTREPGGLKVSIPR